MSSTPLLMPKNNLNPLTRAIRGEADNWSSMVTLLVGDKMRAMDSARNIFECFKLNNFMPRFYQTLFQNEQNVALQQNGIGLSSAFDATRHYSGSQIAAKLNEEVIAFAGLLCAEGIEHQNGEIISNRRIDCRETNLIYSANDKFKPHTGSLYFTNPNGDDYLYFMHFSEMVRLVDGQVTDEDRKHVVERLRYYYYSFQWPYRTRGNTPSKSERDDRLSTWSVPLREKVKIPTSDILKQRYEGDVVPKPNHTFRLLEQADMPAVHSSALDKMADILGEELKLEYQRKVNDLVLARQEHCKKQIPVGIMPRGLQKEFEILAETFSGQKNAFIMWDTWGKWDWDLMVTDCFYFDYTYKQHPEWLGVLFDVVTGKTFEIPQDTRQFIEFISSNEDYQKVIQRGLSASAIPDLNKPKSELPISAEGKKHFATTNTRNGKTIYPNIHWGVKTTLLAISMGLLTLTNDEKRYLQSVIDSPLINRSDNFFERLGGTFRSSNERFIANLGLGLKDMLIKRIELDMDYQTTSNSEKKANAVLDVIIDIGKVLVPLISIIAGIIFPGFWIGAMIGMVATIALAVVPKIIKGTIGDNPDKVSSAIAESVIDIVVEAGGNLVGPALEKLKSLMTKVFTKISRKLVKAGVISDTFFSRLRPPADWQTPYLRKMKLASENSAGPYEGRLGSRLEDDFDFSGDFVYGLGPSRAKYIENIQMVRPQVGNYNPIIDHFNNHFNKEVVDIMGAAAWDDAIIAAHSRNLPFFKKNFSDLSFFRTHKSIRQVLKENIFEDAQKALRYSADQSINPAGRNNELLWRSYFELGEKDARFKVINIYKEVLESKRFNALNQGYNSIANNVRPYAPNKLFLRGSLNGIINAEKSGAKIRFILDDIDIEKVLSGVRGSNGMAVTNEELITSFAYRGFDNVKFYRDGRLVAPPWKGNIAKWNEALTQYTRRDAIESLNVSEGMLDVAEKLGDFAASRPTPTLWYFTKKGVNIAAKVNVKPPLKHMLIYDNPTEPIQLSNMMFDEQIKSGDMTRNQTLVKAQRFLRTHANLSDFRERLFDRQTDMMSENLVCFSMDYLDAYNDRNSASIALSDGERTYAEHLKDGEDTQILEQRSSIPTESMATILSLLDALHNNLKSHYPSSPENWQFIRRYPVAFEYDFSSGGQRADINRIFVDVRGRREFEKVKREFSNVLSFMDNISTIYL
ncbi:hypothetical protein [Vibrio hepatarius]|uniref:hypothetical protein n=1 Tax=Vibrio hepatarius TaxID=171383 RepID=UPI001C0A513B|nr:hypothetical protein [Vibrio hepatarius]MBU2898643.1 hypothetical protein [Vibrio hepatarius]